MKLKITENKLLDILLNGSDKELEKVIDKIHPADILDIIHKEEVDLVKILNRLPDYIIADIIEEEEDEEKYKLLKNFSENKLSPRSKASKNGWTIRNTAERRF